ASLIRLINSRNVGLSERLVRRTNVLAELPTNFLTRGRLLWVIGQPTRMSYSPVYRWSKILKATNSVMHSVTSSRRLNSLSNPTNSGEIVIGCFAPDEIWTTSLGWF